MREREREKERQLAGPTFMWHLPEGRFGGGRARVSHPRAQQRSCRVQRRRRRFPAPRCRSTWRVIRSAVTRGNAATATAASARTKVQVQPTADDRATTSTASSAAAASATAATSGHANTVLQTTSQPLSTVDPYLASKRPAPTSHDTPSFGQRLRGKLYSNYILPFHLSVRSLANNAYVLRFFLFFFNVTLFNVTLRDSNLPILDDKQPVVRIVIHKLNSRPKIVL